MKERICAFLLTLVLLISNIPIVSMQAEVNTLKITDTEGNLIESIGNNVSKFTTVYKGSNSSESLQGLGRNDSFKGYINVKKDSNNSIVFTPTESYNKVWEEVREEVKVLYDLIKTYNSTSEHGVEYELTLDSSYKVTNGDNKKSTDLDKIKNDYKSLISDASSYKSPEPGTFETIRVNRLRSLVMAIEFQSRKVQSLCGIVMPLDLMMVSDNCTQEEASKGVMEMIKKYTEISKNNPDIEYTEIMNQLTQAYNSAVPDAAKITNGTLLNKDLKESSYIKWLSQKQPEDLKVLTEALDLVDLWSTTAWSAKEIDYKSSGAEYGKLTSTAVGAAGLYTYFMADYKVSGNNTNNLSVNYTSRGDKTKAAIGSATGGYCDTLENPTDPELAVLSTMYSQLQWPRAGRSYLTSGTKSSTVFYRMFGGGKLQSKPYHDEAPYYDQKVDTPDNNENSVYHVRGMNRSFITGIDETVDGVDIFGSYFQTLLSVCSTDTFVKIMKDRYGYEYQVDSDGNVKDHELTSDLKKALADWSTNERFTYMYAINLLNYVEDFYNKFDKSVYTADLQKQIDTTIKFISSELQKAGLEPLVTKTINPDTKNNTSLFSKNIVKDFVDKYEWGYELNEDYKELFAWTACFVPFETNLYQEGENMAHLSKEARAKYRRYSRLRQPISIVTKGDNSASTEGIYPNLLSNAPQKLKYCTLKDFIDSSQAGDTFLYATAITRDDLLNSSPEKINTNIISNDNTGGMQSNGKIADEDSSMGGSLDSESETEGETSEAEAGASARDVSASSGVSDNVDVEDSTESETDSSNNNSSISSGYDSSVAINSTNSDVPTEGTTENGGSGGSGKKKHFASLTSSQKYFGPIYAASNNTSYADKYSSLSEDQAFLINSTYTIADIDLFYNDPDKARDLISKGIKSATSRTSRTSADDEGMKELREDGENSEVAENSKEKSSATDSTLAIEYSVSTLMTLQISPQTLYMNFANTYNMLQDKVYTQEGFANDLKSLLYMDFLGNIVTESGYVVIPAAANASRYRTIFEYPMFNAMMLNSYPDVKQESDGISVVGNDSDKYMIYISTEYLAHTKANLDDMKLTSFIETYVEHPGLDYLHSMYFAKSTNKPSERLVFEGMCSKSYIDNKKLGSGSQSESNEDGSTEASIEPTGSSTESTESSKVLKLKDGTKKEFKVIDTSIEQSVDVLIRNQRWFKEELDDIEPSENIPAVDDSTFFKLTVEQVLKQTESRTLAVKYFEDKIKNDKSLRTTYGQTISEMGEEDINKEKWIDMPYDLRKGFYSCANSYSKSTATDPANSVGNALTNNGAAKAVATAGNNSSNTTGTNSSSTISTSSMVETSKDRRKILVSTTVAVEIIEEEEPSNEKETIVKEEEEEEEKEEDKSNEGGIPGKPVVVLPDNTLGVIFITKDNVLNAGYNTTLKSEDEVANSSNKKEASTQQTTTQQPTQQSDTAGKTTVDLEGVDYKVLNFRRSAVRINNLVYQGVAGNAVLDRIPPFGYSYEWLAIKTLNENLYKIWGTQNKRNAYMFEIDGAYVDCHISFNAALGCMVSASSGDEDTSVYDEFGNFIAGAGVGMESADDSKSLKDDKLIDFFGNLFESIYAPYLAGISTNMWTFVPTLDRITISNYFSLLIVPFIMVLLVVVAVILIYMMATLSLKNYTMTFTDIIVAFCVTIFLGFFIVNWMLPVTKGVFESPGTWLMQDDIMMQGLYDMENVLKDKNHVYFLNEPEEFEGSPILYFGSVSDEDCKTYRNDSDKPEVDSIFYLPKFDNEKKNISNSMFLQGNGIYISMYDLFKKSSLDLTRDSMNNLYILHSVDDDAKGLIYYTPYYNLVEGITETVNAYSKSCTGGYNILNHKQGLTTTRRFNNYVNSIFYLSPDDIVKYNDVTVRAMYEGNFILDDMDSEYNYTADQVKLSKIVLEDGTLVNMDANIARTYKDFANRVGDIEDWLQLKRMLYLVQDTGTFDINYMDKITDSRWFPQLDEVNDEEIINKIRLVNERTKRFVISNLLAASYYVSDENLIKLTALKATFEFNKEFGEYFKNGTDDAYPKQVMGYVGNNDYFTKAMYIPQQDIYSGSAKQFSYYICSNSGYISMAIITIERVLFMLCTLIRHISLYLLYICLFGMYVFYIFKNRVGNKALSRITFYTFLLCNINILEIAQQKIGYFAVNNGFNIEGAMFLHICLCLIITYIVYFLIRRQSKLWGVVFSAITGTFPMMFSQRVDYYNNNYGPIDSTEGMILPSNSVDGEYDDYNIPTSEFQDNPDQLLTDEPPTAVDMLPMGTNGNVDVPEGYSLYETINDDGTTSYYASQSNMREMLLPGGKRVSRVEEIEPELEDIDDMNLPTANRYSNDNEKYI